MMMKPCTMIADEDNANTVRIRERTPVRTYCGDHQSRSEDDSPYSLTQRKKRPRDSSSSCCCKNSAGSIRVIRIMTVFVMVVAVMTVRRGYDHTAPYGDTQRRKRTLLGPLPVSSFSFSVSVLPPTVLDYIRCRSQTASSSTTTYDSTHNTILLLPQPQPQSTRFISNRQQRPRRTALVALSAATTPSSIPWTSSSEIITVRPPHYWRAFLRITPNRRPLLL